MEKSKFTYSTDKERLIDLKIAAAKKSMTVNAVIDNAVDAYLKTENEVKKVKK